MSADPRLGGAKTGARRVRGRFAPTPSGPLHLGSLATALGSWLQARRAGGQWLLRIDDLDDARTRDAHTAEIQRQLERHGLCWDESPYLQSRHRDAYAAAFDRLQDASALFGCGCTRRRLRETSPLGPDGPVYPGTCRTAAPTDGPTAWRFRVPDGHLTLQDGRLGAVSRSLADEVGDFVVWRRDGVPGYHLACAVDERAMAISDVVRGEDLLGASFCQWLLIEQLGGAAPRYAHLPLMHDAQGHKLSKQNHAQPIDGARAPHNVWVALGHLGLAPPDALSRASVDELLGWALNQQGLDAPL